MNAEQFGMSIILSADLWRESKHLAVDDVELTLMRSAMADGYCILPNSFEYEAGPFDMTGRYPLVTVVARVGVVR